MHFMRIIDEILDVSSDNSRPECCDCSHKGKVYQECCYTGKTDFALARNEFFQMRNGICDLLRVAAAAFGKMRLSSSPATQDL